MDRLILYPEICRDNIQILGEEIGINPETAYAMMLMTATLMDLNPWDRKVAEMILKDCKAELQCG